MESKCSPYYAEARSAEHTAGCVFSNAADLLLLERSIQSAGSASVFGHCLRQFQWPWWKSERRTIPLSRIRNPPRSSRICIWMGASCSSVERDDRWQDTGCGRDDAGSECGASVNRSSRHEGLLLIVFPRAAREWYRKPPSGHAKWTRSGESVASARCFERAVRRSSKMAGTDMASKPSMRGHERGNCRDASRRPKGDTKLLPYSGKSAVKSARAREHSRNVPNEYMKTRVAKWSGTRAITATTSWLSWSNKNTGATFRSQSEVAANGRTFQAEQAATYANRRRIRGTRGKRLIRRRGEFFELTCSRTTSKREACEERICEDTKIYSSASSRTWPESISGF